MVTHWHWHCGLARDDQNTIMVFRIGAFFCKDEVTKMSPQNSCVGYIIPRVQVKLAKTISLFTGQNYPWSAHPSRSRGHFGHTALCLEKSEVQPLDPYFFQLSERYFAREVRFSCRALRCPSRKKVIFSARSIFDKAEKKAEISGVVAEVIRSWKGYAVSRVAPLLSLSQFLISSLEGCRMFASTASICLWRCASPI